eukprot:scaffold19645_cov140-Isochrysis_galbana.AAC.1
MSPSVQPRRRLCCPIRQTGDRSAHTLLNSIQEGEAGNDPSGGHKESLGRLDQSQHYLLIFTQVTNGLPFVRIGIDTSTSKANWEGEPPHSTEIH